MWNMCLGICQGNMMPLALALASWDADDIINGTITFLESRLLKWGAAWCFWSCDANDTGVSITQCWQHHQWHHCIPKVMSIQMSGNMKFLVMWLTLASHDVDGVINSTIVFLRLRQSKWGETWLHFSCDATGAGIAITWFQWHCQWQHLVTSAKVIKMKCNMTFESCDDSGTGVSIMWWQWHWCQHHVMLTVSSMAPLHSLDQEKWGAIWPNWSCDTTSMCIGITWCKQHCQWHHCTPWLKRIEMMCNKTFLVM